MLSGSEDQESYTLAYTSPNLQDYGQAMSTAISPARPLSITAGDTAPGPFTIDILLDEILLEIFACYVEESEMRDAWHTLAGVCRRWRRIVLGSPRRLTLRIFCTERIPVGKNLDFWPPFPIVLNLDFYSDFYRELGEDNIRATLEHHDRVCQISIRNISSPTWEKALPLMQKPFPILTHLNLRYSDDMASSVVPDSFLGGSAPQLRKLQLACIPFPGLPKLLLSATGLVHLELFDIPDSGYISADAIAACLSTFTRLESVEILFESTRPRPEWESRRTSSSTRAPLPALTSLAFKGVREYLEVIVDRIDAPLLNRLKIWFFHRPVFDTPRLAQFINRVPKFKTCNRARISLGSWYASVKVLSLSKTTTDASFLLGDWNEHTGFQMSPLVQLCTLSFFQALIPTVEDLAIFGTTFYSMPRRNGIVPSLWRELLQPFTAVKDLYVSPEIAPHFGVFLQELAGESVLELFPALQNIVLKELQPFVPEGIEQFVATRQLAIHPPSDSHWERNVIQTF